MSHQVACGIGDESVLTCTYAKMYEGSAEFKVIREGAPGFDVAPHL